jgi:hemolysin activation/secretion protein
MGVALRVWAPLLVPISLFGTIALAADPLTAGAISDTLKRPPELQPPAPLSSPVAPPRQEPPPGAESKTLTVQRFEFSGNSLFTDAQLAALVADYTGKPVSLIQLYEAADRITAHYVEAGYTLASAQLPAQKISEGVVKLEVLEGRVDKVVYEGLKSYRPADLDVYVAGTAGRVYRGAAFEEGLRNIDALPGLDARAVLRPGESYGSTDIVVQGKETPYQGSLFVDNSGRDTAGETRIGVQLDLNNPLRVGDQLSLLGLRSSDDLLEYGLVGYSLPTGWQGSRLKFSYGYAKFELGGGFQGVAGSNRNSRVELELPVLRGGADQLSVSAAVSDTKADTDFSGIPLRATELTLLELGGVYTHVYRSGAVSQLVGNLGSNFQKADATDRNSQRIRLELDAQHIQPIAKQIQLVAHGLFVYSPDPLPDTQQLSIGGPTTIRGHAPSEARGDWGYLGSLTLRRPYNFGKLVLTPRVFVDAGRVRSRDPTGSTPEVTLASVGVGADAVVDRVSLKLDYATPRDDTPVSDGKDSGRVYGTLAVQF